LETFTISKDIISLLSPIVKQGKALEAKIKAQRERKYADQGKNEGKDPAKIAAYAKGRNPQKTT